MAAIAGYELIELIATGGMASVWRAARPNAPPVALKVMRAAIASDETFRQAVRNEVHFTARLDHPGIIRLLNWGETTVAEADELALEAGAPWIAMELAEHQFNSLAITTWPQFRACAHALLDALKHSHARGVIHRDIKPGNILVQGGRYIVTDFGIAFPNRTFATAVPQLRAPMAGTLNYMAPEQLLGRWRDFGPYTDLFSLGVLFFHIATGRLPFAAESRIELGLQHQRGAPALGTARFAVPGGFGTWIRTLLSFDPRQRFAFAADAAHGLDLLGEPAATAHATTSAHLPEEVPTLAWTNTPTEMSEPSISDDWGATVHIGGPLRAPIPDDWRREDAGTDANFAVGLDLFGIRRAPMVGRHAERDFLWSELVASAKGSSGRGVVLRGAAGVGKSMLARWLCERAHELGVADSLRLVHVPGTGAIPELFRQQFQLAGLSAEQAKIRMHEIVALDQDDPNLKTLNRIMEGASVALGEQTMLLARMIKHFTASRPIIVWLDDAHWSLEAIEAAARLTDSEVPVFFVLTVRDEDLDALPIQTAQLEQYLNSDRVHAIRVDALDDAAMSSLLSCSLTLAPQLRNRIVGAVHGNPLLGLQTLQLAVERGVLTVDDDGNVSGHIEAESTEEIWLERLQLAGIADQRTLLAAAVLGHRIELDHWVAVAAALDCVVDVELAHRLVEAGLAVPIPGGWLFEHSSLREAVLARAAGTKELRDAHRAAAQLYDPDGPRTFIAHGFHLVDAGDLRAGTSVLLHGLAHLYAEGRGLTAKSMLEALRRLVNDSDDPYIATQLDVADAGILYASGLDDTAFELATNAGRLARTHEWWEIAARAENVRACVFESKRQIQDSLEAAIESKQLAVLADNRDLQERAACRVAWSLSRLNRLDEARIEFEFALASADDILRDRAHIGLATVYESLGDLDQAQQHLDECIRFAREGGRRAQLADALNTSAAIAIQRGDLEAADRCLSEAHENARLDRTTMQTIIALNWAALHSRQGKPEAARDRALAAAAELSAEKPFLAGYARLVLLLAAAVGGWADEWTNYSDALSNPQFAGDLEFAELFVLMWDAWRARGDTVRATAALRAALRTCEGLTHPRADEIRALQKVD